MNSQTALGATALTLLLAAGAAPAQQAPDADEVRAAVAEMLADAETRSSLLAAGDAGHDGKFFVAGDGFRLNLGGQIQVRYLANFRDDDNVDDFDPGFQIRRARLDFTGVIYRDWDFRVLTDTSRSSGGVSLLEAWGRYAFANGVKLRFGQFTLPLLREQIVSDARLLTVERSLVNSVFTGERGQGVELGYEQEQWRVAVSFSDGLNSKNTDFNAGGGNPASLAVSGEADYGLTGRFEYRVAGDWKQFEDFTSPRGAEYACLLGLAAHWQQSANTNASTDVDRDVFQYTADASVEGDGWNLYGAFVGRYSELSSLGASEQELHDFGGILQGGYRFAENTEIFARWEGLFIDDERAGFDDEDNFHFVSVGLNQYYAGHAAKATIQAIYSINETSPLTGANALPDTGVGLLGDSEEGEISLVAQFQLLF